MAPIDLVIEQAGAIMFLFEPFKMVEKTEVAV
jgi:hypothetical protein